MSTVKMKDPYNFLPWNPEKKSAHLVHLPEAREDPQSEPHQRLYGRALLSVNHFVLLFWLLLVVLLIVQCRLSC